MDKMLLYMLTGVSYYTAGGVMFTSEHPYQLVERGDYDALLATGRFRDAYPDELKVYYRI